MEYLYKKFAKYYDLCYSEKNYVKETNFLQNLIKKYKIKGKKILEMGCGTGGHAVYLRQKGFDIIGVDLNKEMLAAAKKKTKFIKFLEGNMKNFNLNKEFDIVLCLFSTMHYNQNIKELKNTLKNFFNHLKRGGLLVFDMGFNEERWKEGHTHVGKWFDSKVNLVRFSKSRREGSFGVLDMAYILFKNNKFYFGQEKHRLGIFKTLEVKKIAEEIGFKVDIYANYTKTIWGKNSKEHVVFACVKK